jgi:predicted small metal-binding protein
MSLKAVCPVEECGYIAFGDNENEVKRDLRYHLMEIHGINRIPTDVGILKVAETSRLFKT